MYRSIPLSVVLLWRTVEEDIVGSARSLIGSVRDVSGEVLIVTALESDAIETATAAIKDDAVRWIRVEPPLTEPGAWEAGLAASRGTALGFCQARGRYASGWARSALAALANGADVVAGPVWLAGPPRLPSLAAHLCDYAAFDDLEDEGQGGAAACNLAFDRRVLDESLSRKLRLNRDIKEVRVPRVPYSDPVPRRPGHCRMGSEYATTRHPQKPPTTRLDSPSGTDSEFPGEIGLHKCALLATDGLRVAWQPEMSATLSPVGTFGAAGVARFHRGRHYASLRAASWPRWARLAAGLGCLVLPPLLFARLIALAHVRRRHRRTLFLGSPWIAASLGLWSLGEMAGYWSGPGRSAQFL